MNPAYPLPRCPRCASTEIQTSLGSAYCGRCGTPVEAPSAPAPAPAPAVPAPAPAPNPPMAYPIAYPASAPADPAMSPPAAYPIAYPAPAPTDPAMSPPVAYPIAYPAAAPAQGYPYAYPAAGPVAPRPVAPSAIASMVIGILSIFPLFVAGAFLGPLAIGLCVAARRQMDDPAGGVSGAGLATAGLITGIIGTLIGIFFVIGMLASP